MSMNNWLCMCEWVRSQLALHLRLTFQSLYKQSHVQDTGYCKWIYITVEIEHFKHRVRVRLGREREREWEWEWEREYERERVYEREIVLHITHFWHRTRPHGTDFVVKTHQTFLKPDINWPLRFRVRICVDAWNTNDDTIAPPTSWPTLALRLILFFIIWFVIFL